MVEDKHPTDPTQEDLAYEEANNLIDSIMEEGINDNTQDPATPTRPLQSPNKEDESPSKRDKTGKPVDSNTNQANIGKTVHNPYRKSAPKNQLTTTSAT